MCHSPSHTPLLKGNPADLMLFITGYMLGRAAEEPQPTTTATGIHQEPVASTWQQGGPPELSQKASDAFDAAAAGGLKSMAHLKAVTSDIMDRNGQAESSGRSGSPHIGSIEHLSPAANLAMLQACARYPSHPQTDVNSSVAEIACCAIILKKMKAGQSSHSQPKASAPLPLL